jgi:hypothetical protein
VREYLVEAERGRNALKYTNIGKDVLPMEGPNGKMPLVSDQGHNLGGGAEVVVVIECKALL